MRNSYEFPELPFPLTVEFISQSCMSCFLCSYRFQEQPETPREKQKSKDFNKKKLEIKDGALFRSLGWTSKGAERERNKKCFSAYTHTRFIIKHKMRMEWKIKIKKFKKEKRRQWRKYCEIFIFFYCWRKFSTPKHSQYVNRWSSGGSFCVPCLNGRSIRLLSVVCLS